LGIAFSIFGIENIMLGKFKVGFILLGLLFFYDIFWVLGTPVMVEVAKNLDGPIKLMFPKEIKDMYELKDFNMIGLGDIVIPGIYVALMIR
jgi:minor histocompatibility antigen H13